MLKQILSPEEFLIGKTVVKTCKAPGGTNGIKETVSFIFSDGTFMLLRYTVDGIKFASEINIDIESWASENNIYQLKPDPFVKQRYAEHLHQLGLISDDILKKYTTESKICKLKEDINYFYERQKTNKKDEAALKEILNPEEFEKFMIDTIKLWT